MGGLQLVCQLRDGIFTLADQRFLRLALRELHHH